MSYVIRIVSDTVALARPFRYFLETLHALPYARIEVQTEDGITGYGEIACSLDANGETLESAMGLEKAIAATLQEARVESAEDIVHAMEKCELYIAHNHATKCGLEQALFDIVAQRQGVSVAKLLGAVYRPVQVQCTIPYFDSEEAYMAHFAALSAKHPAYIKFKIGNNLELEARMIGEAKKMLQGVNISADANQAFNSATDAARWLQGLTGVLSWIEQPLHREDTDGWQQLKERTSVPLMVDESIHTVREALWYLDHKLVDLINIKLAKSGGTIEARKIAAAATAHQVPVMLGSMLHGTLGLRYNLAFGLSLPFVTLDFYSYFSLQDRGTKELIDASTLNVTSEVIES
jgi:L-Ala-D/L-Glu epimerase